jgi:hypothetical protein
VQGAAAQFGRSAQARILARNLLGIASRIKKRSLAGAKAPREGSRRKKLLVKKQSAGWAQPLVFLLIRIPGLRLASSNGIISEGPFFGHTANPVDSFGIYLKES